MVVLNMITGCTEDGTSQLQLCQSVKLKREMLCYFAFVAVTVCSELAACEMPTISWCQQTRNGSAV